MGFKLTPEERDALLDLMDNPGWEYFKRAVLGQIALSAEKDVLDYNLSGGDRGLLLAKARLEGAKKALDEVSKLSDTLRALNRRDSKGL